MPLDSSSYSLAQLRLDGRRWNELRQTRAQISTQDAADGSSYLAMGNTKVICIVTGPSEVKRVGGGGTQGASDNATVAVEVGFAGFSGVERKKRGKGDKRVSELNHTIVSALTSVLHTHLYPHSTIQISLHVLSQDGSLLAALLNACTLALIDAGIAMSDYLVACSVGSTDSSIPNSTYKAGLDSDESDPLLDLISLEEADLPFLTLGTLGASEKIIVLILETRVDMSRLEEMLAVGIDGCARMRTILDTVVRTHGDRIGS